MVRIPDTSRTSRNVSEGPQAEISRLGKECRHCYQRRNWCISSLLVNSAALARAWGELLTAGNEERKALGQRARRHVIENFSISRVTHAYEAAYRSVVDSTFSSRQPLPDVP